MKDRRNMKVNTTIEQIILLMIKLVAVKFNTTSRNCK